LKVPFAQRIKIRAAFGVDGYFEHFCGQLQMCLCVDLINILRDLLTRKLITETNGHAGRAEFFTFSEFDPVGECLYLRAVPAHDRSPSHVKLRNASQLA
ncbi:MAG: hypothetical protein O3C21_17120, partial [Verrucomicrobia bacterium]|nr:hypothetical protein [Verrucomicrobiota bacterium]